MAKMVADAVLDAALQYLEDNADRLCVCSAEPTTYAEATTTYDGGASKYKLAIVTIDSGDFTGPADGTSGRKTTVNEQAAITVDASASATHIALCKSGTTALLYVTTCTSQALTAGNTVTVPAWIIQIADPT
jgi:hypothetical protein